MTPILPYPTGATFIKGINKDEPPAVQLRMHVDLPQFMVSYVIETVPPQSGMAMTQDIEGAISVFNEWFENAQATYPGDYIEVEDE